MKKTIAKTWIVLVVVSFVFLIAYLMARAALNAPRDFLSVLGVFAFMVLTIWSIGVLGE